MNRDHFWSVKNLAQGPHFPSRIVSPVDSAEMALIPGGEFTMGITENELNQVFILEGSQNPVFMTEVPARKMVLDDYYIDIHPVTHYKYGNFIKETGHRQPVCHPWEMQGACLDIVCGGVLSKFPRLKVAFLEAGLGWIGHWLDRMDGHFEKMGHYAPWLTRKPSEMFKEQCFISMDPDEHSIGVVAEMGLENCVIWGSDYPHFDCTFPGVVDEVKEACAKLKKRAQKKIIGENTRRLYNL